MHCVFCAHRSPHVTPTPVGQVCETCVLRIAMTVHVGGDTVAVCWGVVIAADAQAALARLVREEMTALARFPPRADVAAMAALVAADVRELAAPDSGAGRLIDCAEEHFSAGRAVPALEYAAAALGRISSGPYAERALALLLGPMLKPGGADVLRAALFRT